VPTSGTSTTLGEAHGDAADHIAGGAAELRTAAAPASQSRFGRDRTPQMMTTLAA
jgi:hypothetical protein